MNLGISQLQFKSKEDLTNSISVLKKYNIQNIEVVFSKIDSDDNFLKTFSELGLTTSSTQSILFNSGVTDIAEELMIDHISKLSERCKLFGVNTLVLGSPSQRKNTPIDKLIKQFIRINEIVSRNNQYLCIEPNCKKYNGSYFFTVKEIVAFLKEENFSNIKTMIDTHNGFNEFENCSNTLEEFLPYIHHIHVSENDLKSFIPSKEHVMLADTIKKVGYNKLITYEVLPLEDLEGSLEQFTSIYK